MTSELRLGDVAKFIRGLTFKPTDVVSVGTHGSIAVMRTKNVQSLLDISDTWAIDSRFLKNNAQLLRQGDLLVSSAKSWNLVGKSCEIPQLPWPATFGGFVSVLRPSSGQVEPRYLYRWFSSRDVQAVVRSFGQSTTNISTLNTSRCLDLPMPVPDLAEQRRITAILDEADVLRANRRASLRCLKELASSLFASLFGRSVRLSQSWPTPLLSSVASTTNGGTPDRSNDAYYGAPIPWVKSGEVQGDLVQDLVLDTEEFITGQGLANSSAKIMKPGTVLLAMYGATAGQSSILGIPAATNQAICGISVSEDLSNVYLLHLLREMAPSLLERRTGGAQPNLNQGMIRNLPIPLPPLQAQQTFEKQIESVNRLAATHRAALSELDALFASLQHRAFRGEL